MVEDPFVVTLKDELENWKAFCAECFKSLPRSWLPCNGCVFVRKDNLRYFVLL